MQAEPRFSLAGRVQSFRYAIRGLRTMLRTQHNAWIHAAATALALLLGILSSLSRVEWSLIVVALMAVWTSEALNTALELLCDVASPEFHPLVERSKDVAAGAVLLSSIGALVIGLLLLGPPLVAQISRLFAAS